jgi:uncharacterized damage-inducible protein DinB
MNDINLGTIREMLAYGDWADDRLLECASPLKDDQLDRVFPMGRGSLRKTLIHIFTGEFVWLQRWKGRVEHPWPSESEKIGPAELSERFAVMRRERDTFLDSLEAGALSREQTYRDSRGSLFTAALGRMLLQGCLHSHHHRAQAVNMLRQIGAEAPELDYMYHVREAADAAAAR